MVAGTDFDPAGAREEPTPNKYRIEAKPFRRFDPATLPAREWLYGGHYQRGIVTATVGPGGGGKSSLDLVEMVAMATGRNLLGEQPVLRCRAWYHNAEDSEDEIYRRLAAVLQHYGISQDEVVGWLHLTSGVEMPIVMASSVMGSAKIDRTMAEAVARTIADKEIGVASFDPLVATHRVAENLTGDMDQVVREFARIANATDCAIEIVHHTRKPAPGQEELGVHDSRGAGAIVNAARSVRVLNTMSASNAGVDEVDRQLYFRIDKGKANMAPPAGAQWYRFASIDVPNGDNVGVTTPWTYPGQGSAEAAGAEQAAEQVYITLLVRLTQQGRVVSDSKGMNYAPRVFAQEREAKVAKVGKVALEGAMRRLFEASRIVVETSGSGGKQVRRLVTT